MAKRTSVIDIGSNSTRIVVYEKTSRYSFYLIKEMKSRVRIAEGAYEKNGLLQDLAIKRAINALEEFIRISKNLKCNKILCVATSALRDAPNASEFIRLAKQKLGINIKIIDGHEEAYLGAIAVRNMLPKYDNITTIDIGGGSTELTKIKNGVIEKTLSINLGTVRLKELFFDKNSSIQNINQFILEKIDSIDDTFKTDHIVGIGGTIRALGKYLMSRKNYSLSTVHGYEYKVKDSMQFFNDILKCDTTSLTQINVRKDRSDTIREGVAIFKALIKKTGAKKITTSGVGLREGVYLKDLLRTTHHRFPKDFKLSLESLKDRFITNEKESKGVSKVVGELFDILAPLHNLNETYRFELVAAGKLHAIGRALSFYQEHSHGAYFILNNLNYGFSHKEKILISTIIKFHSKKVSENDIKEFKLLLPPLEDINWLVFLLSLTKILFVDCSSEKLEFKYSNNNLNIKSSSTLEASKDLIKKLSKPALFSISIEENSN